MKPLEVLSSDSRDPGSLRETQEDRGGRINGGRRSWSATTREGDFRQAEAAGAAWEKEKEPTSRKGRPVRQRQGLEGDAERHGPKAPASLVLEGARRSRFQGSLLHEALRKSQTEVGLGRG